MPPPGVSRFDLAFAMTDPQAVSKPMANRHALRNVRAFRQALLRWFAREGADYPWRQTSDPYAIMISEIMLQQTTIGAVVKNRRFERFLDTFPNLQSLAEAPETELLRAWEGLGYYNRVRNLQKAAQVILEEHKGVFPATPEGLEALPGVGRYTAGAVASFAFNYPAPIVDANVARVLSRLMDWREEIHTSQSQAKLWEWAGQLLDRAKSRSFNSALMELGQSHCSPHAPDCLRCPGRDFCITHEPEKLPLKKPKRATVKIDEHVLFVQKPSGTVLLAQEAGTRRKGFWKLPERSHDQLADFPLLGRRRYGITHHKVTMHIYRCSPSELPPPQEKAREQFHSSEDLRDLPMPSPFRKALRELLQA